MATASAPPQFHSDQADRDFSFGLKASIVAHAALVIAIIVKSTIFPGTPTLYVPTLRVDVVGLPDLLKTEEHLAKFPSKDISEALKKAALEAKRIEHTTHKIEQKVDVDKDEMVLRPKHAAEQSERTREKKLKNAMDRIKALEKISEESATAPQVIKGNKISHGNSLSSDAKESAETTYYDLVRDRLQDNWALPVWLSRQNLSAQVQIYIDPYGRLRNFSFVKSSGNAQFDEEVKRTLAESQPFPAPPQDLASSLLVNGILIGFPL